MRKLVEVFRLDLFKVELSIRNFGSRLIHPLNGGCRANFIFADGERNRQAHFEQIDVRFNVLSAGMDESLVGTVQAANSDSGNWNLSACTA